MGWNVNIFFFFLQIIDGVICFGPIFKMAFWIMSSLDKFICYGILIIQNREHRSPKANNKGMTTAK